MQYTPFGKTGLIVSEIALGTWGIGGVGWDDNAEDIRLDAIRAAVESGINFIDTAPAYNAGMAEKYVGDVLAELGVRKKMILATKCGTEFIDGKYVRSCARDKILSQCEVSLRNLRTDYIDLYLIHWPDAATPVEETMDALNSLKKQGKILHVGASNLSKEQIIAASQYCPIEAYQPQYSMVFRSNEEQMRWAAEQGMGVMAYGSLGAGILTGAYRSRPRFARNDNRSRFYKHFKDPMFSRVMRLLDLMDVFSLARENVPLAQIAINWSIQKTFVHSSIVGAQHRERIFENCHCFDWKLSSEELRILDAAVEHYLAVPAGTLAQAAPCR